MFWYMNRKSHWGSSKKASVQKKLYASVCRKSMGEPLDRVPPSPLLIFWKEGVFRALRSAT